MSLKEGHRAGFDDLRRGSNARRRVQELDWRAGEAMLSGVPARVLLFCIVGPRAHARRRFIVGRGTFVRGRGIAE